MRLHLNKTLRAALIAAFVATTAQAAVTTYDISEWQSYDDQKGAAVVGHGKAEVMDYTSYAQQFNTDWSFIVTVNADSITADKPLTLMALYMTQHLQTGPVSGLAEGITLANASGTTTATLTSWSNAAAGGAKTLDLTNVNDLTFVMTHNASDNNLTMKVYADGDFTKTIASTNQTGQKFGSTTVDYVAFGGKGGMERLDNQNNKVYFPNDADTGTIEITKAGYLLGSVITTSDLNKYYTPPTTLLWNSKDSATWDLNTTNWVAEGDPTPTTFKNDMKAVFGTDGDLVKDITVSGTISADTASVNDNYTFTIASDSSLNIGTLSIADGAKLTVNGEGRTMTIGALSNEGELAIGTGATVSMGADVTLNASHTLNVTGDGTFAIQKLTVNGGDHNLGIGMNMTEIALNGGTLTFASGTSTVSGKIYSNSDSTTLVVGTDSGTAVLKANRVELGDTNNTSKHHDLTINAGSTLKITGENTGTDYKSASLVLGEWNVTPTTVTVKGLLIADKVAATAGDSGYVMNINGGTALLKGLQRKDNNRKQELNITNNGSLILGATGIVGANTGNNVSLTVDGGTIGIYANSVTIDKDITVSGAAAFDTQMYTVDDISVTRGETGGTLTVSGNITGTGTITKTGAGELVLSGTANVLTHTIAANAGTLTLSGAFEIGGITPTGGGIVYSGGEHNGNGYETATGNVVVYSGTGTVNVTGSFTYHGKDVTLNNGVYALPGTQDTTTFYINELSESYSWIDEKKTEDFSGIVVKQAGTLVVDKDINMSLVSADSRGTVEIDSGYVATAAAGRNVTLTGTGTYVLEQSCVQGNQIVLPGTLGEGWTGTVQIHDVTTPNNVAENFTPLAKAGSTIELKGFSGLTDKWTGDQTENIKLTNSDDRGYAWYFSGATSKEGYTATFSGAWSGEGTLQTAGNNLNFKFTGDISDWYGKFQVASGAPDLTFSGIATEVNAVIDRNGKTLHLFVGEGSEFSTTFKADVNATSLTVSDNASATFKADATFGSLSGTGKVAVNEGATLTVSGTVAESVKIDAADGATIDADLDTTQVGIAAHATASFVQGVADGGVAFDGDTPVKVTNCGEQTAVYGGIQNEDMLVTADILTADSETAVAVGNEVVVEHIVNFGEGTLTLTHVATASLSGVSALAGDVTLQNVSTEPVVLKEMSLLGTTVAVYTEGAESPEGTVTITETLAAGGGTLLANLTIIANEQGTTTWTLLDNAMTLGSTLALDTEKGSRLIQLDETTMTAIAAMTEGQEKALVLNGADAIIYEGGDWWDNVFSREYGDGLTLTGDYKVGILSNGAWGVTKQGAVPEPTTGTLSLLALAGLCARRRRK